MQRGHVPAQGRPDRLARIRVLPVLLIPHLPGRGGRADTSPDSRPDTYDDGKPPAVGEREIAMTGYGDPAAARRPGPTVFVRVISVMFAGIVRHEAQPTGVRTAQLPTGLFPLPLLTRGRRRFPVFAGSDGTFGG